MNFIVNQQNSITEMNLQEQKLEKQLNDLRLEREKQKRYSNGEIINDMKRYIALLNQQSKSLKEELASKKRIVDEFSVSNELLSKSWINIACMSEALNKYLNQLERVFTIND
ncbi:MAG: hypothetical protein ACM3O4_04465 [Ignavibacteriales bacterium]